MYNPQNPLIVQGDNTVLLEVDNGRYPEGRDLLARFAELEKSPEYIHTYRISPLSLWNAAAAGLTAEAILTGLDDLAKYPLPDNVRHDIRDYIGRYGLVKLIRQDNDLLLVSSDALIITELARHKQLRPYIATQLDHCTLRMDPARRGHIKQALVIIGYPAEDLAGYVAGETLTFHLRPITQQNKPFKLRDYQYEAAATFHAQGSASGGSGVIVLPCGAGKTMVGMAVINQLQTNTLILTPSTVAARQWIDELLDKTSLSPEQIGEYTGSRKSIKPVTISTYQTMTFRKRGTHGRNLPLHEEFPHFSLFGERDWGLIVYDEVHLLPAPVFRVTAELQARRRLGLTATLVREDGQEEDVFSLIGPKKYDVPWRELEKQGWIATAHVTEVRIPLPPETRVSYAVAEEREKARIAAENPEKLTVLDRLLARHFGDNVLIIGMYLGQLEEVQSRYGFPMITGKSSVKQRQELLGAFRDGRVKTLIISKVGNFAIDLPEANVMIQLSGTFGSRQEEAQRLGRILRPKQENSLAYFYTLVSKDSKDQEFSANRQRFLTEQGYRYHILYGDEIADYVPPER
ncbi:MAG: DEAD/DEAH box helicase [Chloroflexi bacterium]|nr:DEAD/DEAH box helicase [Ardenticatenaceae bacterium]MBL1130602.1 helicase [Chloroflexota bacterium]NOG36694.1 DEAD/DEAH box helicase [Chloroflexota bacterium]